MAWEEVDDLAAVAGDVDVLYQTRIQKERFQVCAPNLVSGPPPPPRGRLNIAVMPAPPLRV